MLSREDYEERTGTEALLALSAEERESIAERIDSGEFCFGDFVDFYPEPKTHEEREKAASWGADAIAFNCALDYVAESLRDWSRDFGPDSVLEHWSNAARIEAAWGDTPTTSRLARALGLED